MQLLAVNFHYIRNIKLSQGIFPRSLEEFASQVRELGRHYDFISQADLLKIIREPAKSSGRYCVLTFDDNLKEQMLAYDYLASQSIPAIFFSTTKPYIEHKVHDVHKTHHIFAECSDAMIAEALHKKFNFHDHVFDEQQMQNSYQYDDDSKKRIKLFLNFKLSRQERIQFVDSLFEELVSSEQNFLSELYLSKDNLKELAAKGMLGTHSHSHEPLANFSEDVIHSEIKTSVDYLQTLTGETIRAISYPYGRHGAVDDKVSAIAETLGLQFGFTMYRGINSQADMMAPLLLKRVDTNDAPGGKLASTEFYP